MSVLKAGGRRVAGKQVQTSSWTWTPPVLFTRRINYQATRESPAAMAAGVMDYTGSRPLIDDLLQNQPLLPERTPTPGIRFHLRSLVQPHKTQDESVLEAEQ